MTPKTLAEPSPNLTLAFVSMLGVAAVAGALSGAVALGEWIARVAPAVTPTPAIVQSEPAESEAAPPPAPPPAYRFDAPLPGRVIDSPFGMRQLPWEENGRLHQGVDIAAPSGAAVKIAADGVIKATGLSPTYGRYVLAMHKGGLTTMYAHLASPARGVKKGAFLRRGETVAFVGNSGRSTGSHLHFEIRKNDKPLNPAFFLDRSFAEAEDLPIKAAGRVSRKVRMATVSKWPDSVVKAKLGATGVAKTNLRLARGKVGRLHARIAVAAD